LKKIRGVWLTTAASKVLNSNANIVAAMQLLADSGFNTVFPVVWNNGYTLYPSEVLERNFGINISPNFTGRDILQEIIEAATRLNLDVIPWFEYGFAASFQNNGGHILAQKPHWEGQDKNNKRLTKNNFVWMNSLDSDVQTFMLDLILEVVKKYPSIAGIQGDDRLPAMPSEGGYDRQTQALYRRQFGENPPQNSKDRHWLKWRADILSDFLARLYREVKAINPNLIVSMSPSPFPFGFNEYLQDFSTWIDREIVDFLHPQLYRRNLGGYRSLVDDLIDRMGQERASILSPGVLTRIGEFQIRADDLWEAIVHNRRSGIRGETLFFFESLQVEGNALANLLKEKNYANFILVQEGNLGEDVKEIQQKLKEKNFDPGVTDGRFGSLTKVAIKKFQQQNGLEVDGVVGSLTYMKLIS
jgi:uncharacterized lipoprotein YddW (UPF0748 family)